MYYKLDIECASMEIAKAIQQYANSFNSDEVFWNAISEKKDDE